MTQQQHTSQAVQSPTATEVVPTATVSPDEEWKTYTSSEYNFTFQYPAAWEIVTDVPANFAVKEPGSSGYKDSKMLGECDLYVHNTQEPTTVIAVDVSQNTFHGSYCWSYGYFYDYSQRTITTLDPAGQIEVNKWRLPIGDYDDLNDRNNYWKNDIFQSYIFSDPQYRVSLGLVYQQGKDAEAETIYDQILSTFRFVE